MTAEARRLVKARCGLQCPAVTLRALNSTCAFWRTCWTSTDTQASLTCLLCPVPPPTTTSRCSCDLTPGAPAMGLRQPMPQHAPCPVSPLSLPTCSPASPVQAATVAFLLGASPTTAQYRCFPLLWRLRPLAPGFQPTASHVSSPVLSPPEPQGTAPVSDLATQCH